MSATATFTQSQRSHHRNGAVGPGLAGTRCTARTPHSLLSFMPTTLIARSTARSTARPTKLSRSTTLTARPGPTNFAVNSPPLTARSLLGSTLARRDRECNTHYAPVPALPCDGGACPCTTMLNPSWLQSPAQCPGNSGATTLVRSRHAEHCLLRIRKTASSRATAQRPCQHRRGHAAVQKPSDYCRRDPHRAIATIAASWQQGRLEYYSSRPVPSVPAPSVAASGTPMRATRANLYPAGVNSVICC